MLYAAADSGDAAAERARSVLAGQSDLVISDHVLVEAWRLIRDRLGWDAAERFWSGLRFGPAAVVPVELRDLDVAWQIGIAFPDQSFSLVDRTSFAVMERLGIAEVATFDDDFAIYRFGPRRERAFEIVR